MSGPMLTVLEILQRTTEFFGSKGIENARLNAELLVGHALGLKRMQLYLAFERPLSEAELDKIRPLVRRRAQREPLQYVLGEVEWGGLKLKVDRRALIPRPETEYLLERVAGDLTSAPGKILDLGTGSGALALGLAHRYPEAKVLAVDASDEALALARENGRFTGLNDRVEFRRSDWFDALRADESFDLIVANPPYLTAEETAATAPEVRLFEPAQALTAKEDGLADLLRIVAGAGAHLSAGALLALETGIHQHQRLLTECTQAGFARAEGHKDLTGRPRFVFAWK